MTVTKMQLVQAPAGVQPVRGREGEGINVSCLWAGRILSFWACLGIELRVSIEKWAKKSILFHYFKRLVGSLSER